MNYSVNMLAVLIAGIVHMSIGAAWYTIWRPTWSRLVGSSLEPSVLPNPISNRNYAIAMLNALIISYVLSQVIAAVNPSSLLQSVTIGVTCWFGFVATTLLTTTIFANRSIKLFLIDSIYYLISFSTIALVYAYWL